MEIPERIWHLMAKSLNKEATDVELEELTILLERDPSMQHQFELLTRIWSENGQGTDDEGNARKLILRIIDKAEQESTGSEEVKDKKSSRRRRRLFVSTFSVLLTMAVAWWFFSGKETNAGSIAKKIPGALVVNKGSRSRFLLPDGTTVWLNAGSQLFYENDFKGSTREVRLEGEAFFDVIKDKTRPFIIHTKTIDIKVLGTAFNVRAYETEKNTETALFRGSVEVTLHNNPEKRIVLKPNEKLLVNNKTPALIVNGNKRKEKPGVAEASITITNIHFEDKDSSALETLWIKNKLVFDAESLEQVAQKIERWYDAKVIINGDELKHAEYSGIFDNESIEQVMEALHITGNFKYKVVKNVVTIW